MKDLAARIDLVIRREPEDDSQTSGNNASPVSSKQQSCVGGAKGHVPKMLDPAKVADLLCLGSDRQADPPLQRQHEHLESELVEVTKNVAKSPAHGLVAVQCVILNITSNPAEDDDYYPNIHPCGVHPFSFVSLCLRESEKVPNRC